MPPPSDTSFSRRKIEQAVTQNIHFMWLSGMGYSDHNTINRFRSDRINGLKEVFRQVVLLWAEKGIITLKEAYLDGTKIEANANRYAFVRSRSIIKSKERIKKQLGELWALAEKERAERQEFARWANLAKEPGCRGAERQEFARWANLAKEPGCRGAERQEFAR